MFKIFKRKKKMTYTYLCRTCDVFYTGSDSNKKCPMCNRAGEIVNVKEK